MSEDYKASQHEMGVSIGGDQRYPFRCVAISDQRLQHWEQAIDLPLRTLQKAWEDLRDSQQEATANSTWVRAPTLMAPFISKRRR